MPAKSEKQRAMIFARRDRYKTEKNTPKKWKWIWDEGWENKGKLPESTSKIVCESLTEFIRKKL